MPLWEWILIAAIVVIVAVAAVAVRSALSKRKTQRLKGRFGPEYERTVDEVGQRGAEHELTERERKREKLDIVPLSAQARNGYTQQWRTVQTAFVDDPSTAMGEADELVTRVMRERGYPIDDFDQQAANISVDHPTVVDNYRAAHTILLSQADGVVGTEEQRQAFVHYRALFDKLLETDNETSQEARA
jgi:hypothetical protein